MRSTCPFITWIPVGFAFMTSLVAAPVGAQEGYVALMPDQVQWRDFSLAAGVKVAALYGAPDQKSLYTLRVKMEDGAKLHIHTHPDTRMITVLSGKLIAGKGARYDTANETAFPAGGFFVVPAGMPHYTRAGDGEVLYQENGLGPSPTILLSQ